MSFCRNEIRVVFVRMPGGGFSLSHCCTRESRRAWRLPALLCKHVWPLQARRNERNEWTMLACACMRPPRSCSPCGWRCNCALLCVALRWPLLLPPSLSLSLSSSSSSSTSGEIIAAFPSFCFAMTKRSKGGRVKKGRAGMK